ncbi:TetR/AcrR family transcriptional regulator [Actinospica robiniae]|uniref:TetR/AcrR family transcriptional regulator n=1 Tax=Actinospica robiniae TaxID=304901 RepID=UPI00042455CB|nr:TetR/AcrR family transcriptional regulator [Actinospica robiniae]
MRADAQHNKELATAAARALFSEKGEALQMDDVAARAGIGVATVYRVFGSKESLLSHVASASLNECLEQAEAVYRQKGDDAIALDALLRSIARMLSADAGLRSMIAKLPSAQRPGSNPELLERFTGFHARAVANGAIRPDVTEADVRAIICGMSAAIGYGASPELIADAALHGIGGHAGQPA